jgi:hypothetical protein
MNRLNATLYNALSSESLMNAKKTIKAKILELRKGKEEALMFSRFSHLYHFFQRHDWQKIRFVLIFERFSHFLMGCVV